MDQHELIARIKALASDLGRTPTRMEFESAPESPGKYWVEKLFRNYSLALQAAGLTPYEERRKQKIDSTVFERDVASHLAAYQPRVYDAGTVEPWEPTLGIGDLHAPFANLPLLEKVYRFAARKKPKKIVQVGDLRDRYCHSKFPRSHNLFTPREEDELATAQITKFWAELKNAAPDAECFQLWGNHDARPLKRILEEYPAAEDWVTEMARKLMTFPGVTTLEDYRDELHLPGNVLVHHGYRSKLGEHRDYTLHNFIGGHTHVGGVVFRQIRGQVLWELNCGLAGDPAAKGLTYTPQKTTNWTPGWGWLDEDGPRFCPG